MKKNALSGWSLFAIAGLFTVAASQTPAWAAVAGSVPAEQRVNVPDVDVEDGSLTACTEGSADSADIQKIIRNTFGKYGDAAIKVAKCESGSFGTRAKNGQFLGLFQMGAQERHDYGHSACAETQARAAYDYFAHSHWTWTPWSSCHP